jgi:hypothetical protein
MDQLEAMCGSRKWFGPGSRIIITTRDMHLLKLCQACEVYKIEELSESESLELFSWHAFKQPIPTEDFASHSTGWLLILGDCHWHLKFLGAFCPTVG